MGLSSNNRIKKFWLAVMAGMLAFAASLSARSVPDASDPLGFFTNVADKLLRSTFSFGITNIPVYVDGQFAYTPAVNRLLQVAANVYDASNTNALPTVFRPVFARVDTNVFICGYSLVTNVNPDTITTDPANPAYSPFSLPDDVSCLSQVVPNQINIYGVPWILGAKKGLPNFNMLAMVNTASVTRRLMVSRNNTNADSTTIYWTNQMYALGITNNISVSFWNSYSNDYPRPVTVYASDYLDMALTNNLGTIWAGSTHRVIPATTQIAPTWPGSKWNTPAQGTVPNATPATASFYAVDWLNPFLVNSSYHPSTGGLTPNVGNAMWEPDNSLLPLNYQGSLGLLTTNRFQAVLLDGQQVIDYVQFRGPTSSRNLTFELADPNYPDETGWRYQWSTNKPPASSPNYGVLNQLYVSANAQGVPNGNNGFWVVPSGMPTGTGQNPIEIAEYFAGFFTTFYFDSINNHIYANVQLTNMAPYAPTRTIYEYTLWQANDPLVHYLASDMNFVSGGNPPTGLQKNDGQSPMTASSDYDTKVSSRYQPWGRPNGQLMSYNAVDTNIYNLSYRDPIIWGSDNWNFPTNLTADLSGLGQVHRGTPWQTLFLKSTNILANVQNVGVQGLQNIGTNTWSLWTGDTSVNDAVLMAPTQDWRLAGLLATLLNPNDPTGQFSANNPNLSDWLNQLNGLIVYSNSAAAPRPTVVPSVAVSAVDGNSAPAGILANGILQARASQPNQNFAFLGDFLAAPELTLNSPWLNTANVNQLKYGIADATYEKIPAQLLTLLRPDSIGIFSPTNGGWLLQFSGSDAFTYAVQTSADLLNWQTISTNQPVQGMFSISPSANAPAAFYRSVLLP
jgi:hypothetical protein